jgi:hypothetical protein
MFANRPNSHEFGYENASRRCPLGQISALRALVPDEPELGVVNSRKTQQETWISTSSIYNLPVFVFLG